MDHADGDIPKIEIEDEVSDVICEKCGSNMVIKTGRYGKFLACPNFPECRNTKPIVEEIDVPCPKCSGKVVVRKTKRGRKFYGCSNYPECDFVSWDLPVKNPVRNVGPTWLKKHKGADKNPCLLNDQCKYKEEKRE